MFMFPLKNLARKGLRQKCSKTMTFVFRMNVGNCGVSKRMGNVIQPTSLPPTGPCASQSTVHRGYVEQQQINSLALGTCGHSFIFLA